MKNFVLMKSVLYISLKKINFVLKGIWTLESCDNFSSFFYIIFEEWLYSKGLVVKGSLELCRGINYLPLLWLVTNFQTNCLAGITIIDHLLHKKVDYRKKALNWGGGVIWQINWVLLGSRLSRTTDHPTQGRWIKNVRNRASPKGVDEISYLSCRLCWIQDVWSCLNKCLFSLLNSTFTFTLW